MASKSEVENIAENLSNIDVTPVKENVETYDFEAEVPQVMSLIINSVYSSKEMFLRELISNASDAISKVKTMKTDLDSKGYATCPIGAYKIQIIPNKNNNTLVIKDNGVGMTKNDLIAFLGSIASSGTKKFKEILNSQNQKSDLETLIGQFGLGFYSAFLVADKVDVITKNPMDDGYLWTSTGGNSYSICKYDTGDLEHGTSVILTLKEGEKEYLESTRLINLIKKHSLYIRYPIAVFVEKEEEEKDEEEAKDTVEEVKEDAEPKIESEAPPKKIKKVVEEQIVNNDVPIWTKKVEEIPEEELNKFYRTISNDYDDYAAVQSWHFEGVIDLKIILFIPKRARFNFFEQNNEKNKNIKVFNSNVFVTDDLPKEVVPDWMNMVVGTVSSPDFPMNISREFLQGKAVMNMLKTKLPKCISEMIKKLEKDEEKYNAFYKEFASNIKLAIKQYTDTQQETFAKFLRYPTNQDNEKLISFDEYLSKVSEGQKQILFLTGLTKKDVETSLCLEGFKDRLVLLMPEAVDEIMLQGLKKYKGLDLQNISIEGVDSITPIDEETKKEYEPFTEKIKDLIKEKVERVEISNRFVGVPASILTTKYGNSSTMENIIKAQPGFENNPMLMMMLKSKKIFEINIDSPVIKQLKRIFDEDKMEQFSTYVNFLYNAALVGSGFTLEEKSTFIKDLYSILSEAVSSK
ncbi:uncharacterized protein VICG_01375 [Vittaforma corneae ATCC 50505]|uniref:Hsp90-like protein n=1 Tax=Vittaforma corneae (strain ATCC 50505) TaxID=993615 RepID=L2GMV4_VITCO|nr:uncharacterized protein VICG_01375 [Vittaforma corneae ATCC 50505]ELA41627.1 hypothetical protein VICG_01375 [Vittaforma corneae ATCC 50505]